MKQPTGQWQSLLADHEGTDSVLLKRLALILSLGTLAVMMLIALVYIPFSVPANPIPVDPSAAASVEGSLGAEYVLQSSFISGRYVIPLLVGVLSAVAMLVYAFRAKDKKA